MRRVASPPDLTPAIDARRPVSGWLEAQPSAVDRTAVFAARDAGERLAWGRMRIAVAGGSGKLGRAVVDELLAHDHAACSAMRRGTAGAT
jgi:hypothetical protein